MAIITVAPTIVGLVLVMGAWKMLRLRSYGWAVASAVLALLPLSAGFMLGMPMGIWALYVLSRSEVQTAFTSQKRKASSTPRRQTGTLFGIELQEHLKIVAYLRIGVGSVLLLVALVVFSIMAIPGFVSGEAEALAILSAFGFAFALFPLALAVPNLVGGIGLLKHRPKHRILVLILGAIDLFGFPIGTLIGVYTIWLLVQKETVQLFASTGDVTE